MKRKKLRELADFLAHEVKDEWFDLGVWASEGFEEKRCGSVACAMGWASVLWPDEIKVQGSDGIGRVFDAKGSHLNGITLAAAFFDIYGSEAEYLFCPEEYVDKWQTDRMTVAKRIKRFAKTRIMTP